MLHPVRNHPPRDLLQIKGGIGTRSRDLLIKTWTGLPLEPGSPVQLAFLPELTAHRGKLLSGTDRGTPVYAAAFIRQRRIVLETSLLADPAALRFMFVHELFHFVWVRLGNKTREEYSRLLSYEIERRARGELGESSAVKKAALRAERQVSPQSAMWRDYACESFCDSASSIFTGASVHEGPKLGKIWSAIRSDWFQRKLAEGRCWAV